MATKKKADTPTAEASENTKHAALQEETSAGTVYYLDAAARDRVKARASK
jgi:hypothetical protein